MHEAFFHPEIINSFIRLQLHALLFQIAPVRKAPKVTPINLKPRVFKPPL